MPRTTIPPPQSARIMQRYVAGASIREIARQEKRDRATVTKVVKSSEMMAYTARLRERLYGLGEDALEALEYALSEERDARLAYEVVKDIGVVPTVEEQRFAATQRLEALQAATAENDEEVQVKRYVGRLVMVAMERSRLFGTPLPPQMVEATEKKA